MLDAVLEIFDFLQGTAYFVYTIVSAADDIISFLLGAIPFIADFLTFNFPVSIYSISMYLCLGLGLIKFLYPGAES